MPLMSDAHRSGTPSSWSKWTQRGWRLLLTLWMGWSLLALSLGGVGPGGAHWIRALLAIGVGIGALWAYARRSPQTSVGLLGSACLATTVWFATLQPSNDRAWTEDQSRLPSVRFDGDTVHITDLRGFRYRSPGDWDARWFDASYDLSTLQGVDFAVERFSANEAVAHTLLSFPFADGRALAVSVEIRKEQGESYGVVAGMFRQYELMVVLGDERDLLELRAVHRQDDVYLHPMTASPEQARALLESLLQTAQDLHAQPRWYHTVQASCTSVLAQHLQTVADVPLDHRIYLPGYSDALAFELGLIQTTVDFEGTRARNHINPRAVESAGSEAFGVRIREGRSDQ